MKAKTIAVIFLFVLATGFEILPQCAAQQKPLTKEQVLGLVRNGLGDESGAKVVKDRGLDFTPDETLLKSLKSAGASEVFIQAVRGGRPTDSSGGEGRKPLSQIDILALLAGDVSGERVATLVEERGIDFQPTEDFLNTLKAANAGDVLLGALRKATVRKPQVVDQAAQANRAQVSDHMTRAIGYLRSRQPAQAEDEYRQAVALQPGNPDLHASLATSLMAQRKWDEAAAESREALGLNPNHERAHYFLGVCLRQKGDLDGAIPEFREAARLNPKNEGARIYWGQILIDKGDLQGAGVIFHEILSLHPDSLPGHYNLGEILERQGNWDGAILEFRQVTQINAQYPLGHLHLGNALGNRGDTSGAVLEIRRALELNPKDAPAHYSLGTWLEKQGDRRSALAEYGAAAKLDPKYVDAYERLRRGKK